MLQLRSFIARDHPISRDDPQWKSYDDKEHYRIWYLSKMRDMRPILPNSYDAAVCEQIKNQDHFIISEINLVCVGSDAICEKLRAVWAAWQKQRNAAVGANLARKQPPPP